MCVGDTIAIYLNLEVSYFYISSFIVVIVVAVVEYHFILFNAHQAMNILCVFI